MINVHWFKTSVFVLVRGSLLGSCHVFFSASGSGRPMVANIDEQKAFGGLIPVVAASIPNFIA